MSKKLTRRAFLRNMAAVAVVAVLLKVQVKEKEEEGIALQVSPGFGDVGKSVTTARWRERAPDSWHYHRWCFEDAQLVSYSIDDVEQLRQRPVPVNEWVSWHQVPMEYPDVEKEIEIC